LFIIISLNIFLKKNKKIELEFELLCFFLGFRRDTFHEDLPVIEVLNFIFCDLIAKFVELTLIVLVEHLSKGARSGYSFTQNVKKLTAEEFFFENLNIPQGGKVAKLYNKYNRIVKACFTSHFAQEKIDILWDINEVIRNYFKGNGQMNLNKFLGIP
jgi:hypothetical protein